MAGWTPYPRPDWVTVVNIVGGSAASPAELVALDEESLRRSFAAYVERYGVSEE